MYPALLHPESLMCLDREGRTDVQQRISHLCAHTAPSKVPRLRPSPSYTSLFSNSIPPKTAIHQPGQHPRSSQMLLTASTSTASESPSADDTSQTRIGICSCLHRERWLSGLNTFSSLSTLNGARGAVLYRTLCMRSPCSKSLLRRSCLLLDSVVVFRPLRCSRERRARNVAGGVQTALASVRSCKDCVTCALWTSKFFLYEMTQGLRRGLILERLKAFWICWDTLAASRRNVGCRMHTDRTWPPPLLLKDRLLKPSFYPFGHGFTPIARHS